VDGYEVALVPSGSFLTRRAAREWARPASVVAIGAPEYALTGVRLRSVPPCVPPALDLRPGDVIRGYAGRPVSTPGEFEGARTAAAVGGAPTVKLIVWRDGHERELETPRWCDPVGSPLVAPVEPDPTAPPRLEWGGAELLAVRAAHDTAPAGRVTELSGARATARNVHALRSAPAPSIDSADLIVFVAHGRRNDTYPLDSALLLAPDAAPGRVTELRAAEVVGWKVRARLVVLSGCWSGLGPPTAADGPVGLAHGFLATGAEGCLVSNWEASDHATALLMSRFHLNLAGRRPGLTQPFPPRAALAEAKRWLRELTGSEIVKLSRLLRTDPSALNRYSDPTVRVADEARPYRDPYYWAGFALVGVPD
jgi:CHAT domain